jgi:hypothetical protein
MSEPLVAAPVALLSPRRPVGLLRVELDDEVVIRPVQVDGEAVDDIVEPRHRDAVECLEPPHEAAFPAAARVGEAEGLVELRGAPRSAPVCGKRLEGVERDERGGGGLMGQAVDRPTGCGEVEQGLGDGGDAEGLVVGERLRAAHVHAKGVVAAAFRRRRDFDDLANR